MFGICQSADSTTTLSKASGYRQTACIGCGILETLDNKCLREHLLEYTYFAPRLQLLEQYRSVVALVLRRLVQGLTAAAGGCLEH